MREFFRLFIEFFNQVDCSLHMCSMVSLYWGRVSLLSCKVLLKLKKMLKVLQLLLQATALHTCCLSPGVMAAAFGTLGVPEGGAGSTGVTSSVTGHPTAQNLNSVL